MPRLFWGTGRPKRRDKVGTESTWSTPAEKRGDPEGEESGWTKWMVINPLIYVIKPAVP